MQKVFENNEPCRSKSPMQAPCTAQLAGHTSDKSDPARLRETWDNILAAYHLMKCVIVNKDPDLDQVFAL